MEKWETRKVVFTESGRIIMEANLLSNGVKITIKEGSAAFSIFYAAEEFGDILKAMNQVKEEMGW